MSSPVDVIVGVVVADPVAVAVHVNVNGPVEVIDHPVCTTVTA